MPYSFVQIEQDKSRTIQWSFSALVLFYFVSALILVVFLKFFFARLYLDTYQFSTPMDFLDWSTVGWTMLGAGVLSVIHWQVSTNALIDKTLGLMGARPPEENVAVEKMFKNIVEEAGVAVGGKHAIEACVLPVSALNAFALQDLQGRCVIGITQGLLARLNREQIEAVIAHEAGHIASGDCVSTTVTTVIFRVFDNICDAVTLFLRVGGSGGRRDRRDGRIFLLLLAVLVIASVLKFLGYLASLFISREREYRADALSVRLTRNPLALAEALYIIDNRWKGIGMPGQGMDAIFILNPRKAAVDDQEDFFSSLFSTHPPVRKRIGILLDMAHVPESALDLALKKSVQKEEPQLQAPGHPILSTDQWLVRRGSQWQGPFSLAAIKGFDWMTPDTPIKKMGAAPVMDAREDLQVSAAVPINARQIKNQCPRAVSR